MSYTFFKKEQIEKIIIPTLYDLANTPYKKRNSICLSYLDVRNLVIGGKITDSLLSSLSYIYDLHTSWLLPPYLIKPKLASVSHYEIVRDCPNLTIFESKIYTSNIPLKTKCNPVD